MKKMACFIMTMMLSVSLLLGVSSPANATTRNKSDSAAELKKKVKSRTNKRIVQFVYDDFDKDGKKEAFVVLSWDSAKTIKENGNSAQADIWFVNKNGVQILNTGNDYYINGRRLHANCKNFFAIDRYYTTSAMSYMWYVEGGRAHEMPESGQIDSLQESKYFDCLTGNESAYDALPGGIGHTWKAYYFKFTGNALIQYGGNYITEDDLKKVKGGKEIVKKIKKQGYISSIYSRGNGIIHINYEKKDSYGDYSNENAELYYKNGKVYLKGQYNQKKTVKNLQDSGYGGIYKSSMYILSSTVQYPYKTFTSATSAKRKYVTVKKASLKKDGKGKRICTKCKKTLATSTIPKIKSVKLSKTTYRYTGKTITPAVKVKDRKGKALKKGTDYKVSYAKGRKKTGTYRVKVKFVGKYTGTKTLKFKIKR